MAYASLSAEKIEDADVDISITADSWSELKSIAERIEDAFEDEFGGDEIDNKD